MALRSQEADQRGVVADQKDAPAGADGPPPPAHPAPSPSPAAHPPAAHPPAAHPSHDGKPPRSPAPPNPRRRLVLAVVALAALAGGGQAGWSWWTLGRFTESTNDAYVQADITVLAAKVSGYLQSIEVANNQPVRAGEIIARLDDGDYLLAVEAARNKAATQQSALLRIDRQIAAATAAIEQAAAQRDSAAAEVVRAAADFDRQQQLTKSDFASRAHFDDARAARDRAAAARRSADAGLTQARANVEVLAAQREEAQRLLVELETQVRKAERDLSFTVVRAPFDGVIGNKAVDVGSYVEPGKRLAALVPLNSLRIDANFKETQLARMRPGQPVHIRIDAFPDREFAGSVVSLAAASGSVFSLLPPDNATGNFTKIVQRVPVRVVLSEAAAAGVVLRPGMSAEVRVDVRSGDIRSGDIRSVDDRSPRP